MQNKRMPKALAISCSPLFLCQTTCLITFPEASARAGNDAFSIMHRTLLFLFIFSALLHASQQGRIKRCFSCRSRGDLGDCKDPFPHNATTVEVVRAVEAPPCASGWCAKIVEGRGDDYAIATERMCLQRPPGDEEQRCAPTLFQGRRVLMCFCKGDLCNAATTPLLAPLLLLCATAALLLQRH